jgi:hypothetical protein
MCKFEKLAIKNVIKNEDHDFLQLKPLIFFSSTVAII